MKKFVTLVLAGILALGAAPFAGLPGARADAKTVLSAKGETIFLYAEDTDGKAVLVNVMELDDLKKMSHGQENGDNYYFSSTDNYPTTQYCEAKGLTIDELLDAAEENSGAVISGSLHFRSGDSIALMATDSYGNYTRTWSYDDLCAPDRYYFEGLYDTEHGWNTAWEIAGEDTSKYGIDLDTYNEKYKDSDSYYEDKRAVFKSGVKMPVILASESFSGRTTTESLAASTEAGIAAQIAANGGVAAGSLKDMLTDETALRLCIPATEADLMAAHRTAYDNFKWIYNLKLDMKDSTVKSLGTVAESSANFSQSGDTLNISVSCATPGASIYYSFDGAPQQLYTGTISYDTEGADLTANPVTLYLTAVKEGYDDAGVISVKYPQSGVVFKTIYSAMTGQDLVFEAESGVTDADWNAWAEAILGITVKTPSGSSYTAVDSDCWRIDNEDKTLTFDSSVTAEPGAYSFLVAAKGFANKRLSVSLKNAAPSVSDVTAVLGSAVTVEFDNQEYQNNLYLYISSEDLNKQLISASYTDRTVPGRVTVSEDWFALDSCPVKEAGTYTLELMNNSYSPVSQTLTLTLTAPGRFIDVQDSMWFAGAVNWAVDNGVFNGVSENEFAPDLSMTRAMFATVLWRMNESPEPEGTSSFTDVKEDQWYTDAVVWASEKGLISGYGGGLFGTDDPVTREQIAAILFRYTSQNPDLEELAAVRGDLSVFTDYQEISEWAEEAMSWANGIHMINGMGDQKLAPKGMATRAQVATMLMNYTKQINS